MSIPQAETRRLAEFTTLKVGGEALVVPVETKEDLLSVLTAARADNVSVKVLGGGSNVLVNDEGVAGLVIKMAIKGREVVESENNIFLTVGAGEVFDEVVAFAVENSWWGLENLSHIPGSVGATPVQNVGAYGVEIKDLIEKVAVVSTADNSQSELSAADCQFSYRDSIFKHETGKGLIITSVTYRLSKKPQPVLHYRDLASKFPEGTTDQSAIRKTIIDIRSHKFPDWHEVGTAGSFFKNPIIRRKQYQELLDKYPDLPMYEVSEEMVKIPLGYVLDKILNLKGAQAGEVGNYEGQALVIVNHGKSAQAVDDYANAIAEKVMIATGIKIEREVTSW